MIRTTPKSFPVNTVYAIAVDAIGRVWVATDGGGLVRVVGSAAQPERIRFDAVTRAQGLTSDTVYGIVPDSAGRSLAQRQFRAGSAMTLRRRR